MKRRPERSLRQVKSTYVARARGFSRWWVSEFFDVLDKLLDQSELARMLPGSSLRMKQAFLQCRRELDEFVHRKVNARWVPCLMEKRNSDNGGVLCEWVRRLHPTNAVIQTRKGKRRNKTVHRLEPLLKALKLRKNCSWFGWLILIP
jgi:hypothetical protein